MITLEKDEFFTYPHYAINAFAVELNDQLAAQLKILLEEKHLYQKVAIDPDPVEQEIMKHVVDDDREAVNRGVHKRENTSPRQMPLPGSFQPLTPNRMIIRPAPRPIQTP